jgi:peptidoglycan/xylan/chitin deacetylase (PgdA/CDA1 family)
MRRVWVTAAAVLAVVLGSLAGYVLWRGGGFDSATSLSPSAAASRSQSPQTSSSPTVSPSPSPSASSPSPSSATDDVPDPGPQAYGGPKGSINNTGSESVALTFDDGPSPKWTPKVLETLRHWDVKATFCLIGTEVRDNPQLVADIVAAGHTLCNHGWHHEMNLGTKSRDDIADNLGHTNDVIHAAAPDARIGYFRQPGGKWTDREIDVAAELGMAPLHWSVDPGDWDKSAKSAAIKKRVLGNVGPGGIVLMHDGGGDRGPTFDALEPILTGLCDRYELIPLPT